MDAAQIGQQLRAQQDLPPELRRAVLAAPPATLVEIAIVGYWPTISVPLLIERGAEVVPAIDAAADAALDRRPRAFEGTILLWARHALTGQPHPARFDALLDRDLSSTAPAPKIADATRDLLRALPLERRQPLVLPGPRWAWVGTCPTPAVAHATVLGLGELRSSEGNALNAIFGAAALGPFVRPYLRAALTQGQTGNRAAWTATLAKLADPDALTTLETLLRDPDPDVRRWARDGVNALTPSEELDLHATVEALYRRALAGESWQDLWSVLFAELAERGIDLQTAAMHLSHRTLAEGRDRSRPRPQPYGSSPAFHAVTQQLGPQAVPILLDHLLRIPPDGFPLSFLRHSPLTDRRAAFASALAERLGDVELSAHDALLFDWLVRDAPEVPETRLALRRGLTHPDARIRLLCERRLNPTELAAPTDPWDSLPALLQAAMAPCVLGSFECRLFDRDTGTLWHHSEQLEDPPSVARWIDGGGLDEPTLRAVLAATPYDQLRPDPIAATPTSWEEARSILDQVYAQERRTHLGAEIDALLDPLLAAFKALGLSPLHCPTGVYQVAYDQGVGLRSDRYLGCYWYLNDQ